MKAFNKVLGIMQNKPLNGHALANLANIESLTRANKEIQKMMKKTK